MRIFYGYRFSAIVSCAVIWVGRAYVEGRDFMGTEGPFRTPSLCENSNTVLSSVLSLFSFSTLVMVNSEIWEFCGTLMCRSFHLAGTLDVFEMKTAIVFLLLM